MPATNLDTTRIFRVLVAAWGSDLYQTVHFPEHAAPPRFRTTHGAVLDRSVVAQTIATGHLGPAGDPTQLPDRSWGRLVPLTPHGRNILHQRLDTDRYDYLVYLADLFGDPTLSLAAFRTAVVARLRDSRWFTDRTPTAAASLSDLITRLDASKPSAFYRVWGQIKREAHSELTLLIADPNMEDIA